MLMLLWNVSATVRGYMRFYMPTNIVIDMLRTPRRLKWAIPVASVATPSYIGAMAICAPLAVRPGFGWLNLLVLLIFWNAMKFIWIAVCAPLWALGRRMARVSVAGPANETEPLEGADARPATPDCRDWRRTNSDSPPASDSAILAGSQLA